MAFPHREKKLSLPEAQGLIPPDSKVIAITEWRNSRHEGYVAEIEEIFQVEGKNAKVSMLQFMFAHNKQLVCLQASVGPVPEKENPALQFETNKALFFKIADTFAAD